MKCAAFQKCAGREGDKLCGEANSPSAVDGMLFLHALHEVEIAQSTTVVEMAQTSHFHRFHTGLLGPEAVETCSMTRTLIAIFAALRLKETCRVTNEWTI